MKLKSPIDIKKQEQDFNSRFRERELEQELADIRAKLDLTQKELNLARRQSPPLEVQRVEVPVRTEIIYEKVREFDNLRTPILFSKTED